MHQTGASVLEYGKKQISIQRGKAIDFLIFVSMGHCVLHNSAFYCRARLHPRCFNYRLSVDNFPDFSSWGFMLGPRPHPRPEGSVYSGNSILTALLLSALTVLCPTIISITYFQTLPTLSTQIISPLSHEPQARKKTSS